MEGRVFSPKSGSVNSVFMRFSVTNFPGGYLTFGPTGESLPLKALWGMTPTSRMPTHGVSQGAPEEK